MTFEEYAQKHLVEAQYGLEAWRLIRMGWNARGEYGDASDSLISKDAYDGAREDLQIWKKRALEAEKSLKEELAANEVLVEICNDLTGPVHMGEPVLTAAPPQPAHCQTCNDNGMIGGPSYAQPDEGGEPCPDCSESGIRDRLRESLAETLGEAMDCTRVWEAWGVGTMGPNDFQIITEDDERLEEIVDAALSALSTAPHMDKWIKCSNRLPEPSKKTRNNRHGILVQFDNGNIVRFEEVTETLVTTMRNGPRQPLKYEAPTPARATHWMEIKAPAEGVEQ